MWRETYRGLAPAEAFALLDAARRLPAWRAALGAQDAGTGAIVGCRGANLLGVAAFGPARHPGMGGGGEVTHLYVRAEARGSGLGARLLTAAFGRLRAAGHARAALAVVRQNAAARGFYRAMGGTECGAFTDPGPLWRSENVIVCWTLNG